VRSPFPLVKTDGGGVPPSLLARADEVILVLAVLQCPSPTGGCLRRCRFRCILRELRKCTLADRSVVQAAATVSKPIVTTALMPTDVEVLANKERPVGAVEVGPSH
jgi:hypothetical protein